MYFFLYFQSCCLKVRKPSDTLKTTQRTDIEAFRRLRRLDESSSPPRRPPSTFTVIFLHTTSRNFGRFTLAKKKGHSKVSFGGFPPPSWAGSSSLGMEAQWKRTLPRIFHERRNRGEERDSVSNPRSFSSFHTLDHAKETLSLLFPPPVSFSHLGNEHRERRRTTCALIKELPPPTLFCVRNEAHKAARGRCKIVNGSLPAAPT